MPISLIPTKKSKGPVSGIWSEVKIYLRDFLPAIVILGLVMVIYIAGSVWLNTARTEYENLQEEKEKLLKTVGSSEAAELKSFVERADALRGVINNHNRISNIFTPIEESTHSNVVIKTISIDTGSKEAKVEGQALSFEALGEQLIIWKEHTSFIAEVELNPFQKTSEGVISFTASLIVRSEYFK